ncbi:MAG: hypothetical protein D6731_17835 [Planctomycetota bacterium]|nr:MAG: hypothetical protein D6731_17835 [Planctomycetota bacterium]
MRDTDVEIPHDVQWLTGAPCLLTGEPAELRPVKLRRMIFVGVAWFGEDVTVPLPLSRPLRLTPWQYLRMLRPTLGVALAFPLVLSLEASAASGALRLAAVLIGVLAVWFPLGWILGRVEPVRLLGMSRDRQRLTLRFGSIEAAERAKTALGA